MEKKQYFIYVNLDGFGKYYYDIANSHPFEGTPNINELVSEGVYFKNAYTGIPSITFPMQSAILSGAYSNVTENVYKYYDRELNKIVLCKHLNKGQTIGEILRSEDIPFISIQQFGLLNKGAEYDNENFLYIQPGGDYIKRFNEFYKILKGEKVLSKEKYIKFDNIPQFIFVYIDDLDSIGHNPMYARGKMQAFTEDNRIKNVVSRLIEIDREIGVLIKKLKDIGIYDNSTILLTTDHGMVPFKGKSSLLKLKNILKRNGFDNIEVLANEGDSIKDLTNTEVVITGSGLEIQIYFKNKLGNDKLMQLKNILLDEEYIEYCLTKEELFKKGINEKIGDLIVSPKPPFHFNLDENTNFCLKGGHDSLNEKSQHIFAVIKGNMFKEGYVYEKKVQNIDFIPTICEAFKLNNVNKFKGRVLIDTFSTNIKK